MVRLFDAAKGWLERRTDGCGFVSEKLSIGESDSGKRGIFLRQAIQADEVLIGIPREAILTEHSDLDTTSSEDEKLVDASWPLARRLQRERELGEASSWKEYVDLLPQDFSSMPFMWPEASLNQLPFKQLRVAIAKVRQNIIAEADPGLLWAYCAVSSRAFLNDKVLLPFVELCNHSFEPLAQVARSTRVAGVTRKRMELFALRAAEAGEEVTMDYSAGKGLTNDELLFRFGFVLPNNEYDCVSLPASMARLRMARLVAGFDDTPESELSAEMSAPFWRIWRNRVCHHLLHDVHTACAVNGGLPEEKQVLEALLHLAAASLETCAEPSVSSAETRGPVDEESANAVADYRAAKQNVLVDAIRASREGRLRAS